MTVLNLLNQWEQNTMNKDCAHPYCKCLDYCENNDPYSEAVEVCRGCKDVIKDQAVIAGLCLDCAKDTYYDR